MIIPTTVWDATNHRVKKSYSHSLTINSILDKIRSKVKSWIIGQQLQVNC
ncbi:MAG: hypothetical protein IPK08_18135 [Bacteroidetes bacterium]|nr:hypothetical protein [Bacteroidota bacterium]